jgi:large subunit ribosomal protein L5
MSENPKKKAEKGKPTQAEGKAVAAPAVKEKAPDSRGRKVYREEVVPYLVKRFAYRSPMQVPYLEKIVVNMGIGDSLANIKLLDAAVADLQAITGQKAAIRRSKVSIANFKLRAGAPIGAMVTLRGPRMWEFLDRLLIVAIPTIRDFRGLSAKSFDGRGNYTFGIKEQTIFPEIKYEKVEKIRGMDITLVTSARNDEEGYELLKAMKWPFREK